jgi:hypothetical protein
MKERDCKPRIIKVTDYTSEKDSMDGNQYLLMRVKLNRWQAASWNNVKRTIAEYFTDDRWCGHAWDCCGCWRWTAFVWNMKRVGNREYIFQYSGQKNI